MNTIRNVSIVLFLLSILGYCHEIFPYDLICTYNHKQIVIQSNKNKVTVLKYNSRFYINNINNLNEVDDYVEIHNGDHNIIFPLKCDKI